MFVLQYLYRIFVFLVYQVTLHLNYGTMDIIKQKKYKQKVLWSLYV